MLLKQSRNELWAATAALHNQRVALQEAARTGFGLMPVCGRQLVSRPQGAQEGSPKHS